jgi:hypothetical protein
LRHSENGKKCGIWFLGFVLLDWRFRAFGRVMALHVGAFDERSEAVFYAVLLRSGEFKFGAIYFESDWAFNLVHRQWSCLQYTSFERK